MPVAARAAAPKRKPVSKPAKAKGGKKAKTQRSALDDVTNGANPTEVAPCCVYPCPLTPSFKADGGFAHAWC